MEHGLYIRKLQRWAGIRRHPPGRPQRLGGERRPVDPPSSGRWRPSSATAPPRCSSGISAAWLWRSPRAGDRSRSRSPGSGVPDRAWPREHSSRCFDEVDVTLRRGIPVTTPTRTILDLAGRQHAERTRKDLNDLMGRGLVTLPLLDDALRRLARRGRPGITVMRSLDRRRSGEGGPAGSNLELVVEDLLDHRGLPPHRAAGRRSTTTTASSPGSTWRPPRHIAVEVDSDRFHHGLLERRWMRRRRLGWERSGWVRGPRRATARSGGSGPCSCAGSAGCCGSTSLGRLDDQTP